MTNYHVINIDGKDYRCKLTTGAIIDCEEKLGCNPVELIFKLRSGKLPTVKEMVTIFHYSLRAYHGEFSMEETYALFDLWLNDHYISQFISEVIKIYQVSGIIKLDDEAVAEEETKN